MERLLNKQTHGLLENEAGSFQTASHYILSSIASDIREHPIGKADIPATLFDCAKLRHLYN